MKEASITKIRYLTYYEIWWGLPSPGLFPQTGRTLNMESLLNHYFPPGPKFRPIHWTWNDNRLQIHFEAEIMHRKSYDSVTFVFSDLVPESLL
jgi:hypothetical protein